MQDPRPQLHRRLEEILASDEIRSLDLIDLLGRHRPEDVAAVMAGFPPPERDRILAHLGPEETGVVLEEADDATRLGMLDVLRPETLARALDEMGPDEGADIIELLPERDAAQVLARVEDDQAAAIRRLQAFDPDTAGGQMTTEFVRLGEQHTAREAIGAIQGAVDAEMVNSLYVVDADGVLKGVVSLRDLITAPPERPVRDFMSRDVVFCSTGMDQEEVARLADRYNVAAIPVVDDHHRLQGVITHDDILDVVQEEAEEDLLRLAGTAPTSPTREPVLRQAGKRLPWLLTTMAGGVVLSLILDRNEAMIHRQVEIAFFMPFLAGMGGNVGLQTSTTLVRAMATGELGTTRLSRVVAGQVGVGALIGTICGAVAALAATAMDVPRGIGLVVGIAMVSGVTTATFLASVLPLALRRAGADPALAAGPLLTTINDITTLTIYFSIAGALLQDG
ncbi:MAG: magnesium transporter [Planctomycetes bacterium]|nr:magnesium transporter [Planctomycetota bacterium]